MPLHYSMDPQSDTISPRPLCDPRTSPQHLRAVSYLYGLDTAPLGEARVLELGCGTGLNLLPFALAYPNAQIIGIDIDQGAVALGKKRLDAHKAENFQIFAMDMDTLLGLGRELGTYHYIIVRGYFSMLDAGSRRLIQRFCRDHLTDDGIACFDYAIYPGARDEEALRYALQFHSSLVDTEEERIHAARGMLSFIENGLPEKNPAQASMQRLVERAKQQPDSVLGLQYLGSMQEPCHFIEFADSLSDCGLAYVGDADPHTEVPRMWGRQVREWCDLINPGKRKVLGQQYLDFLCNRSRRLSIVTRDLHLGHILPEPAVERLHELRWAGNFIRCRDEKDQPLHQHLSFDGEVVITKDETVQAMLDCLGYAWPASLDFRSLESNTRPVVCVDINEEHEHNQRVREAMWSIFLLLGDKVQLMREPSPYDKAAQEEISIVPGVWLSQCDKSKTAGWRLHAINHWHRYVEIDLTSAEREVLCVLDGKSNSFHWQAVFGEACKFPSETEHGTPAELVQFLSRLENAGVLQGSPHAWLSFSLYRQSAEGCPIKAAWHSGRIMMQAFPIMRGGAEKLTDVAVTEREDKARDRGLLTVRAMVGNGDFDRAEQYAKELVDRYPNCQLVWHELGRVYIASNRHAECLPIGLKATALQPREVNCYTGIAVGLKYSKQLWLFQHLVEMILRVAPECGAAWDMLGSRYIELNMIERGTHCAKLGVALEPRNVDRLSNLARSYSMQMRMAESLKYYEKALEIAPEKVFLHNNYLFTSLHHSEITKEDLFARHRRFGRVVEKKVRSSGIRLAHFNEKTPDRKIRVGFVSGDLRNHAVAYFIEPYFRYLDRNNFSVQIYNNNFVNDSVTERLKSYADSWDDVAGISDIRLAKRINRDQIDILFDLSGHTAHNRLGVFAFKPAPLQVSWIGYPGTTGMRAIDYYVMNASNRFDGIENQFSEKLIYVSDRILFSFDPTAPDVNMSPFENNGYVTFGSFNRLQKISDHVLSVWSQILNRVPGAKLILGNMTDDEMAGRFQRKFAALGVDTARIEFQRKLGMREYLRHHHKVDVLLDTFPYNGGTTTNHALWMGVPTLTLAGQTLACRHGVPLLTQYGLTKFIAFSVDEYIEKAVQLGRSPRTLVNIRANLRDRIRSAPFTVTDTINEFEIMLKQIWTRWCMGLATEHIDVQQPIIRS